MKQALIAIFLAVFASQSLAVGDEQKDYNICKKEVLKAHPESRVEPKKIRGKAIHLNVWIPGEGKKVIRCLRNDYTLVTK